MPFVMMGFDQVAGVRRYAFQSLVDGTRIDYTVAVELALIPRYGIRIQELPLLCRALLERRGEGVEQRTLTFTEAEMRICADNVAAAQKSKPARKLPGENAGATWRTQQL